VRLKAHTFEVDNATKAMRNFTSLLGTLVKVPKSEVEAKRAKVKEKRSRRRRKRAAS
jgi:hypothetical protein